MEEVFLKKAKERIEVAKLCLQNNFLNASVSNCYYAFFNLLQSVLGNPPKGKWKHKGIVTNFSNLCMKEERFCSQKLEEVVEFGTELYELRRMSDYLPVDLTEEKERVIFLVEWVESLIREVENEFKHPKS